MLDVLGGRLFLKGDRIIRQIGHTTKKVSVVFFPKTISAWNGLIFAEAPSLVVFISNFLNN